MLTNETRRELLNRAKASGFPGSITDVFQAADQGIDLIEQHQMQQQQEQEMQVANTPQEQEIGLREQHAMGNTQASMAFPDVQPNQSFNTVGMAAPIDIQKIDNQGHLVESYKNVPPGIQDLPTGPSEGTIIESPASYQKGGAKDDIKKYEVPEDLVGKVNRGLDNTININPRVYRALEDINSTIGEPNDYRNLVGYEQQLDYARFLSTKKDESRSASEIQTQMISDNSSKITTSDIKTRAIDATIKSVDKLTDKEFVNFNNELQEIAKEFKGVKSMSGAMSSFYNADLSGIEKYRNKMGLSRKEVLNLIQPSETANIFEKGKIATIKKGLKLKKWQKGGFNTANVRRNELKDAINLVVSKEPKETQENMKELLLQTNYLENTMGYNPKAYGRKYTNSQASIDKIMFKDLFSQRVDSLGKPQGFSTTQKKYFKRLEDLGLPSDSTSFKRELRSDNPLAAVAAMRMVYGRSPYPLPDKNKPDKIFNYYDTQYRKNVKIKDKTLSKERFTEGRNTDFKRGGIRKCKYGCW